MPPQLHLTHTAEKSCIYHLYDVLRQKAQQDRRTDLYDVLIGIHLNLQKTVSWYCN